MQNTFLILTVAVAAFTAIASVLDLTTRRLPNWLTVGAFVLALVFHTLTGGLAGLMTSLGGFAVGFGILLVLWLTGGGGGGDVKLMGALGAWLGAPLTLVVFLLSAVIALVAVAALAVGRMLSQAADSEPGRGGGSGRDKVNAARRLIPYAVPVMIATWAVLLVKLIAITEA